jgi:hypothetical protein
MANDKCPRLRVQIKWLTSVLFALFLLAGAGTANAGVMYNFVEQDPGMDGTNDILAQLTLTKLPADSNLDFELLSFTTAGKDLFNDGKEIQDYIASDFRSIRPGDLIINVDQPDPLGMGLGSNMSDGTLVRGNGANTSDLRITFMKSGESGLSTLTFRDESGVSIEIRGNWVSAVPEPSSMMLWGCFAFFGIGGSLRRSKRK